jgi:hypothetical protein
MDKKEIEKNQQVLEQEILDKIKECNRKEHFLLQELQQVQNNRREWQHQMRRYCVHEFLTCYKQLAIDSKGRDCLDYSFGCLLCQTIVFKADCQPFNFQRDVFAANHGYAPSSYGNKWYVRLNLENDS